MEHWCILKKVIIPPYSANSTLFRFLYPGKLIELDKRLAQNSQALKTLQKEAVAIVQTAELLYKNESYQYP